jgi:FtsH-binding integral membrane protein
MNYAVWVLSLFALAVIYIIALTYSQKVTPQIYITNTYLYVLLAIIIASFSWTILDANPSIVNNIFSSTWSFVALIVLTFVFLFFIFETSPNNFLSKHLSWFVFVLLLGILSYTFYIKNTSNNNMGYVVVILITIVSLLTWFAYTKPLDYFDSWGYHLLIILGTLIIIEFGDFLLFYDNSEDFLTRFRFYNWIGIILFSGLLLYDTQMIRKDAIVYTDVCNKNQKECVDYPYPNESLNILLDILNLFASITNSK